MMQQAGFEAAIAVALNDMRDEWQEIKKCLNNAACKTLLKVYRPHLMFNKPQSISIQRFLKQHLRHAQFTGYIFGIHHHITQKQIIHQKVHQFQINMLRAVYLHLRLLGGNCIGKGKIELMWADVQFGDGIVIPSIVPFRRGKHELSQSENRVIFCINDDAAVDGEIAIFQHEIQRVAIEMVVDILSVNRREYDGRHGRAFD